MNRKALIVIGAILIIVAVGAVFAFQKNGMTPTPAPEQQQPAEDGAPLSSLSNEAACSAADAETTRTMNEPFHVTSAGQGVGIARIEGTVTVQSATVWGERIDAVYIEVATASPLAFESFNRERVERGNTVNRIEDGALLFKLGMMEDGHLASSAAISERARATIERVRSGESTALSVQVPVYLGSNAPLDFTFACAVRLAE